MTTPTPPATEQAPKRTSFLLLAAPVLLLSYTLWSDALEAPQTAVEHPALYGSIQQCAREGDPAFYAQSAQNRAQIKMARYPFYPSDGPRALSLLSEAELCFSVAGRKDDASKISTTRTAFEKRVDDDYRGHRLRLSQALTRGRLGDAQREARSLISLLDDQPKHAYVRWLNRILRRTS